MDLKAEQEGLCRKPIETSGFPVPNEVRPFPSRRRPFLCQALGFPWMIATAESLPCKDAAAVLLNPDPFLASFLCDGTSLPAVHSLVVSSAAMRRAVVLTLLLTIWGGRGMSAQTSAPSSAPIAGSALKLELESLLKNKQLFIHDFLGDPVIRYRWHKDQLEHDSEHVFTLGVFALQSVEATPTDGPVERVVLKGIRATLLKDGKVGYGLSSSKDPVRFEIDLRDAQGDLSAILASQLFYASLPVLLNAVPPYISAAVDIDPAHARVLPQTQLTWIKDGDVWSEVPKAEVVLPTITSSAEPHFSEEARLKQISGIARVCVIVAATGRVDSVWIFSPLGAGLNAEAVKTAFQYRFIPAQSHGHPVATLLVIQVEFRSM